MWLFAEHREVITDRWPESAAVVYGHLRIPRTTWHDGVRFAEVSLGCPREWRARGRGPGRPRHILLVTGSPG